MGFHALGLVFHRRPFVGDGGAEIGRQSTPKRRGFGFVQTRRKMVYRGRSACLFRDDALGIRVLLPNEDNRESQEDRIKHADGCEFEAGDFIVGRQFFERDEAANENGAEACKDACNANQQEAGDPKRLMDKKQHDQSPVGVKCARLREANLYPKNQ